MEELQYQITDEPISTFNLTSKDVSNPKQPCKIHYDLWYLVATEKIDFDWLHDEFYDAGWFSTESALKKMKSAHYRKIVQTISNHPSVTI